VVHNCVWKCLVLDKEFIKSLGLFDIVYSWGVLHHTDNMWEALNNAQLVVKNNGFLFIAIYNDQGSKSMRWRKVKQFYCSGLFGKIITISLYFPLFSLKNFIRDLFHFRNPYKRYSEYKKKRGMSMMHDWIDWLGGYPFEVAKPEDIFHFNTKKGFLLVNIKTRNDIGCNEFVFKKATL